MLVREVVSGIDFKDEDMIDSGLSPSISVNAQQKEELDQQETTPIDPHQRPHILEANEHSTWKKTQWILKIHFETFDCLLHYK